MQKEGLELVFLLDRSASMAGLEENTVDSFNSLIDQQKKVAGECLVTTILFDTLFQVIHDRVPLHNMVPLTAAEFVVQGHTAFLDAVGSSIQRIKKIRRSEHRAEIPGQTMVVIITDGMDNASRRYNRKTVRRLIRDRREQENWSFLLLGANIDAVSTAREIGMDAKSAADFISDAQGLPLSYEAVSQAIREYREKGWLSPSWRKVIEENNRNRS